MKKSLLLYVSLALLAVFAFSVLAVHYGNLFAIQKYTFREANLSFTYQEQVLAVTPQAEAAASKSATASKR